MATVSLEIEGRRVDLFDFESIVLNSRIKDINDIGKVGSDFTQTFSLPDSPNNRLIFKNFQEQDIINGFDARKLVEAKIRLNGFEFRQGVISLDSIQIKNGNIDNYKVTFYGNTVSLKTILGEDKLNVLQSLNTNNFDFNGTNVVDKLQINPVNNLIVSLISVKERFFYETGNVVDGNLATNGGDFRSLKPSIRLKGVVQAISDFYSLNIPDLSFIDDALFLFLHNTNKTFLDSIDNGIIPQKVDGFSLITNTLNALFIGADNSIVNYSEPQNVTDLEVILEINVNALNLTKEYSFRVDLNGSTIYTENNTTGVKSIRLDTLAGFGNGNLEVFIAPKEDINIDSVAIEATADSGGIILTDRASSGAELYTPQATFVVSDNMPDIKVIDFMSGIFKMFNLVAFFEKGSLILKPLDDFYNDVNAKEYDISKLTDISNITIKPSLPYKQINLGYQGLKTTLANNHNDLFYSEWGTEEYKGEDNFKGGNYDVSLPFEHLKYERLIDESNDNDTDITLGFFVDKDLKEFKGLPLIHYNEYLNINTNVAIRTESGTTTISGSLNFPSNIKNRVGSNDNLHFKREIDEFNRTVLSGGTLFDRFYQNSIVPVFSRKSRIIKLKCYLPLTTMLNLRLNDVILFRNKRYRINSYQINLATMETDFELLNIVNV